MYKDQSVCELRLNLVEGPVDLRQFTVLRAGRLSRGGLRVAAGIIGASHVVRVQWGEVAVLHEVFACTDVVSDAPRAYSGSVAGLDGRGELDFSLPGDVRYRFRSKIAAGSSGFESLRALAARIECAMPRAQVGLRYAFPRAGTSGDEPETLVWVGLEQEAELRVETAHSYPNEDAVVFSDTRVSPEPR